MISSKPNHLPKVPSSNIITLRGKPSSYAFWDTIQSKALAKTDLLVPATPSLLLLYSSQSQKMAPRKDILESSVSFTVPCQQCLQNPYPPITFSSSPHICLSSIVHSPLNRQWNLLNHLSVSPLLA